MENIGTIISDEDLNQTNDFIDENYLQPIEAVNGVEIPVPTSNQGGVQFDGKNTNLIIFNGKDGNKNIIWTAESYGNPNQDLIRDNLVNSEITKLNGEEGYQFYSEFDYTDSATGLKHCAVNGGEIVYNPANNNYEVTYDKSMYEGAMGVSLTEKEYIDPDTYEQRLIENYPVQALIYKTIDEENKTGEEIIYLPSSTLQSTTAINNLLMSEELRDKEILVVLGYGVPNTLENNAGIVDASTFSAITVMNAEKGMSR